jgi:eukaryotic-like serine/threonine-protein kinase
MNVTGEFILPEGASLVRVSDLPEQLQRQISAEPGDYALSRRNWRSHSKILDPGSAALIREFEKPNTIARAVARFSASKKLDAERVLDESLPLLRSLLETGLLVAAGSPESIAVVPSVGTGSSLDGWMIVSAVQAFEDCEVYQVRSVDNRLGAMKMARAGVEFASHAIAREIAILTRLDGAVTPRVLATGVWMGRPYLVSEWIGGSEAQLACAEFQQFRDPSALEALRTIAGNIVDAYAELHERGVIHGDVNPRNVLVDAYQRVKLVDFGLALFEDDPLDVSAAPRGGVSFYLDPESATVALGGSHPPPASFASEQYAAAAMLYQLITGSHYLNFSFEKGAMLQQIAHDVMVPFNQQSVAAWPDAERTLAQALEKEPRNRFASMADFARAWREVAIVSSLEAGRQRGVLQSTGASSAVVAAAAVGGVLMDVGMAPPTTCVAYGSSGLAYTLYRTACARGDGSLLALADAWCERSLRTIGNDDAFLSDSLEIVAEGVGPHSLYHGALGVYAVATLIASARGDRHSQDFAADRFLDLARQPGDLVELTGGLAGTLLGCAMLWNALPTRQVELRDTGNALRRRLQEILGGFAPIGSPPGPAYFGIAHGWAGLLYSVLTWLLVTGEKCSDWLRARLEQLAAFAHVNGRGLRWDRGIGGQADPAFAASWCNGAAGYVFLWTQANRLTSDSRYFELAEGAAWHAWEDDTPNPNLCCGMAGRAYALLNLYRSCGEASWLRRAERILERAAAADFQGDGRSNDWRNGSLYKGNAALALLEVDIVRPEDARMPLFEPDV